MPVCKNCAGTAFFVSSVFVAVDFQHVPAKRLQRAGIVVHSAHVEHLAVDLQSVFIQKQRQIGQFVFGSRHDGFPNLSFLELAIAAYAPRPARTPQVPVRPGHTDSNRQPLPQRAGAHIHIGKVRHVGMALQPGSQLAQREQFLRVDPLMHRELGVQGRGGVPFRKHEPVPHWVVQVNFLVVKPGEHIRTRQRSARMARASGGDHLDNVAARLAAVRKKNAGVHTFIAPIFSNFSQYFRLRLKYSRIFSNSQQLFSNIFVYGGIK